MNTTGSSDTSRAAERMLFDLARQAPAWRKVELMGQLYRTVCDLALSGLRERFPHASVVELRRRLADILLGPELATGIRPLAGNGQVLTEPTAVTLKVIDALEALDIRYLIGGSFASAIHGVARMTAGVDLVVDLRTDQVDPLVRAFEVEFYVDGEAVRDAVRRRESFNLIHLATMFKVDVLVIKRRPFDEAQMERRVRHTISLDPERHAYVATAEDNILAKLEWYRMGGETSERQWNDVQNVLKTQVGRLDLGHLRQWAVPLGVADLLERALKDASS